MLASQSKDATMAWNPTHIFWQEQIFILSILLPPVFITSFLLALFSPRLFATLKKDPEQTAGDLAASAEAVATQ